MTETATNTRRIYTTATESMDIRGTVVINSRAGVTATGRDVRMVEIPEDSFAKQVKYYVTSLHAVMDEQEWRIEQQFGNITPIFDDLTM